MPTATRTATGDPTLQAFLGAGSETAAALALEVLLTGDADRTLRDAIARSLRDAGGAFSSLDDIAADTRVKLVRKLWSLRRGEGEPIENFAGYVASAGANACYSVLRQRYPERIRFRTRVRYAVAHHPSTCLTQDVRGLWVCGLRAGLSGASHAGRSRLLEDPEAWLRGRGIEPVQPLPALIVSILSGLGETLSLDQLVEVLETLSGTLVPTGAASHRHAPTAAEQLVDPRPGIVEVLQHREALARTWEEIAALPARQRIALLMNLRDADGGSVLQMLPSTGVVTQADVAVALELDTATLDRLWPDLPVDDLAIAAMMSATRQQVINLRKAARARLARRLGGRAW